MMSMAVNAEVIEYEDDNFYYDLDTEAKSLQGIKAQPLKSPFPKVSHTTAWHIP